MKNLKMIEIELLSGLVIKNNPNLTSNLSSVKAIQNQLRKHRSYIVYMENGMIHEIDRLQVKCVREA